MSDKVKALDYLNSQLKTEFTFGSLIKNIRLTEYEDMTQKDFAEKVLKISGTRLSDIENDRKLISIKNAIVIAIKLKQSKRFFIKIAIDDLLKKEKLNYKVDLIGGA